MSILLFGCPRRDSESGVTRTPAWVRDADRAWEERGDSFEEAEDLLHQAYADNQRQTDVLWRLVRLQVAKGLAAEEKRQSQYAFAEGRSLGLQCLDLDPAFQQRRVELGWPNALEVVQPERVHCLTWTTLAWVKWVQAHGAEAAALDIATLDELINAANLVATDEDRGLLAWAAGILAAVRTDGQGDLTVARSLLELALVADPAAANIRADLIFLVAVPNEDLELL
ncbi:MAG: hypothetical protein HN348_28240, partial [Proteobacteria bacterium]|nr:hypothetical protein [Pseudomonadota bacterium]